MLLLCMKKMVLLMSMVWFFGEKGYWVFGGLYECMCIFFVFSSLFVFVLILKRCSLL